VHGVNDHTTHKVKVWKSGKFGPSRTMLLKKIITFFGCFQGAFLEAIPAVILTGSRRKL
jgi:hypothetical protein